MNLSQPFFCALALLIIPITGWSQGNSEFDAIVEAIGPYDGPSVSSVEADSLIGKVMTGYQGWFRCEGDGADEGWFHYRRKGKFEPGHCSIDLWPDLSEFDEADTFPTPFRHADGSTARLFSSVTPAVVQKHFEWMRDYGIDGAFVQRFTAYTKRARSLQSSTTVLANCRAAANQHGRVYALMYDTDFDAESLAHVRADWMRLIDHLHLTKDPAYLRHEGKPVIALWGCGFIHRKFDAEATRDFLTFLKEDPTYGQASIMLGIPFHWMELRGDCLPDPELHGVFQLADVLSPWTIGRFQKPEQMETISKTFWQPEITWCNEREIDYLPVAYPGFSWHNLNPEDPLDQIPRLGGRFLWSQYVAAQEAGATMIYQAMFDEVDEGTAIFKCSNDPPVGASPFLTYEGLPSDHYLWLTGQGGRLLRGEIGPDFPTRNLPK